MNIIFEGGFNFYEELNKEEEDSDENICLISHEPLIPEETIRLMCGHRFNYGPLFKEIVNQKKNHNVLEVRRLSYNQLKCPYCRSIQNKLLPYFSNIDGVSRVWGVNHPQRCEMTNYLNNCQHQFKSGKRKGQLCSKYCIYKFCPQHSIVKSNIKSIESVNMETLTKYTLVQLRQLCKLIKLKGYSKLKKQQLIDLIEKDLKKD